MGMSRLQYKFLVWLTSKIESFLAHLYTEDLSQNIEKIMDFVRDCPDDVKACARLQEVWVQCHSNMQKVRGGEQLQQALRDYKSVGTLNTDMVLSPLSQFSTTELGQDIMNVILELRSASLAGLLTCLTAPELDTEAHSNLMTVHSAISELPSIQCEDKNFDGTHSSPKLHNMLHNLMEAGLEVRTTVAKLGHEGFHMDLGRAHQDSARVR